jgi:hypothetical protein
MFSASSPIVAPMNFDKLRTMDFAGNTVWGTVSKPIFVDPQDDTADGRGFVVTFKIGDERRMNEAPSPRSRYLRIYSTYRRLSGSPKYCHNISRLPSREMLNLQIPPFPLG